MLKGKVALITGASRGIGKAIALQMAQQGADVAILYSSNSALADQVCAQTAEHGVRAKAYCCNVTDSAQCKDTVKQVISDLGGIDILVNNAGITRDGLLLSMKEQDFDAVIDTNLKGPFYFIKHCYSHFMKKRSGRIINISSIAGLMGNAGQGNYSAAKAGVIGLTKTIARELSGRNVTCNAIAPGFITTDMTDSLNDKVKDMMLQAIPLKRCGTPDDVAALAAFLASDAAGYITGEVIKVDGGLYI